MAMTVPPTLGTLNVTAYDEDEDEDEDEFLPPPPPSALRPPRQRRRPRPPRGRREVSSRRRSLRPQSPKEARPLIRTPPQGQHRGPPLKYPDHPEKFADSGIDLHDEIHKLKILAGGPELVNLNTIPSILGLLSHDNTDIAIVGLLQDLTDVDVLEDNDEPAQALVDALIENNVLELLVQNLLRLSENDPDEMAAIYSTLATIEDLIEMKPAVTEMVCEKTKLIRWLLGKIKYGESEEVGADKRVDVVLQAVVMYKSQDLTTLDEEEMVENLFDCLCCLLMPLESERFLKAEGFDVVGLLQDLTDEDVLEDNDEPAQALFDALIENNVLELLVQNLLRLSENDPDEMTGIYITLTTIENSIEVKPALAEMVCEKTKLVRWLLGKIKLDAYPYASIAMSGSPPTVAPCPSPSAVIILSLLNSDSLEVTMALARTAIVFGNDYSELPGGGSPSLLCSDSLANTSALARSDSVFV
ncbi:ARM repeat superfamily protein [Actinidia rufa]|uniref:ARM repeat superfamily protein n=1 Tax=Actinidia rufa TaxID=165716 RepID=A0A7J0EMY2_9ERIC|nr:ARM repeat superfamily protein [Actinidia rufa]